MNYNEYYKSVVYQFILNSKLNISLIDISSKDGQNKCEMYIL